MQSAMESVKQGLGIKPTNILAGIDVAKMYQIRDNLKSDPSLAKVKYHINCTAERDLRVVAEMSRFELGRNTYKHSSTFKEYYDQPKQILGNDSAPSPTEHLLSALGGCLTMSLLKVAACENVALSSVVCKVKGKVDLRSAFTDEFQDIAPGLKAVCAKFEIQGEQLERNRLNELIQKAQRHSVVTQTLKKGTPICVCLKGEERAFERKYGLESEEGVRGSWESVSTPEHKPGFAERAKEAVQSGAERAGAALGLPGSVESKETGVSGQGITGISGVSKDVRPSERLGTQGFAGRDFEEPTITRYSTSKLDEPQIEAERLAQQQSPGREQPLPIGTEMKEPGAFKEKPGHEATGRISEGLGELSGVKKETTR